MKKLFFLLNMLAIAAIFSVNLTSCSGGDDPIPAPTVKILADVDPDDQYTVNLTVQATDATSYSWTYGDGETSSQAGNHSYTYPESGDYTISVTVTNESGTASATADVTINASLQEMLAGVDAGGKTWVMATAYNDNDGAGPLLPQDLVPTLPFSATGGDVLGYVGFPAEYDNEFTFKPDGGYSVNNVNGVNLSTAIKAIYTTGEMAPGVSWNMGLLGFATFAFTEDANPTWSVDEDATIELDVMSDRPETANDYTAGTVKYENVTQLSVTGSYFGLLDITNNVMIEKITAEEMQVIILIHTEHADKPSIFARMTFVPKQ
uniref:PKD domain-containing protein n=1 Tax=uncultured Draconibacterium sp. TaxID=1573823 RepID=UPI0032168CAE